MKGSFRSSTRRSSKESLQPSVAMPRRNPLLDIVLFHGFCFLWIALLHSATVDAGRSTRRVAPKRSGLMFGTMDQWIQRQQVLKGQHPTLLASSDSARIELASSSQRTYNPYTIVGEEENTEEMKEPKEEEVPKKATPDQHVRTTPIPEKASQSETTDVPRSDTAQEIQPKKSSQSKMWPPWPFNLLQGSSEGGAVSSTVGAGGRRGPAARMGGLAWSFFGQRARVSCKEMQDIGSRLWFHLPPMTPPVILLALVPRQEQRIITSAETGLETLVTKTVIPLFSNSVARSLVFGGFSLACFSWAHSELNRLRKLTPLPLNEAYRDIHKAVLPHILPDEVPEPFVLQDEEEETKDEKLAIRSREDDNDRQTTQQVSFYNKLVSSVPPGLQRHFKKFSESNSSKSDKRKDTSAWSKVQRLRDTRKIEAQKVRRMAIYDELIALQAVKGKVKQKEQKRKPKSKRKDSEVPEEPLGYALVTGASRGIGRAIAVELARWEIPLILVARDVPRLTSLAYDLEACYGIRCCVLQADLSQPHAAEEIHAATQQAGLQVDILVNNAGLSSTGLAVDMPMEEVNRIIGVNGLAVAQLAHIYGRDMKERRRGRILMVSSVVGAVSAGPTVALYAATKAFEKVLGLSLAKELEPYGVGVTCLMPGAVRDTDFRSSSNTKEALCWKLPYYTRSPATVAQQGIRALLAGDVEVTPGWQNRAFLKVFQPAMPQRLHTILVEIAWNPPRVPPFLKLWKPAEKRQSERQFQLEGRRKERVDQEDKKRPRSLSAQEWRPRSNSFLPPPLLLAMPGGQDKPSPPVPLGRPEPGLIQEPPLVGQEPTTSNSSSSAEENDAGESKSAPVEEEGSNHQSEDQSGVESHYDNLRKLPFDTTSSDRPPGGTEPAENDTVSENIRRGNTPTVENRQASQNLEVERHLLQLREETLKLQQQVQAQERKQFLEQIELDRRRRELSYERQNMDRVRDEMKGEHKTTGQSQVQSQHELAKEQSNPEFLPKENAPKTRLILPPNSSSPPPLPSRQKASIDLMEESLMHPLFAP